MNTTGEENISGLEEMNVTSKENYSDLEEMNVTSKENISVDKENNSASDAMAVSTDAVAVRGASKELSEPLEELRRLFGEPFGKKAGQGRSAVDGNFL